MNFIYVEKLFTINVDTILLNLSNVVYADFPFDFLSIFNMIFLLNLNFQSLHVPVFYDIVVFQCLQVNF